MSHRRNHRCRAFGFQAVATFIVSLVWSTVVLSGDNLWTPSGPYGGIVRQLVVDPQTPTTLFAAGDGGVFKSLDGGANWAPARNGITDSVTHTIAIDPTNSQIVYAGSIFGGGVYKSADGGATWTERNTGIGITLITSLAVDPQSPATVYAGAQNGGMYKSTNGAASWTWLNTGGLPLSTVSAIAIDPAAPSTLYAGMQSMGVYKSVNGGATWTAVNNGLATGTGAFNTLNALAIDRTAPGTLYAGTNGAIYKTTNGGASWAPTNGNLTSPSVLSVAVDPLAPATLYIGLTNGVHQSVNGGATWTRVSTGLTNLIVRTLAIDPTTPTRIYSGTDTGVFTTINAGGSWVATSAGLSNTIVQAVAIDPGTPTTLYAGTKLLGVVKSIDGGISWNPINSGIPNTGAGLDIRVMAVDPVTASTIYAGTGAGVYKSVNGGASWTSIEHGTLIRNISSIVIDPLAPATVRVGTFFTGVFTSTNGGDTWTADNAGLPATPSVNSLGLGGGQLLAGTPSSGVFLTSATGVRQYLAPKAPASWQPANTGLSPGIVGIVGMLNIAGPWGIFGSGKFFAGLAIQWLLGIGPPPASATGTIPKAGTWMPLPSPTGVDPADCPPIKAFAGVPGSGKFYSGAACGVLVGTNSGAQIAAMNAGLPPNLQVSSLAIAPSGTDIYAGTEGGGVFRFTTSATSATVDVIEYYNATLDHYFVTWVAAEQANLDAGRTPTRWTRTGSTFKTHTAPQPGTSPVCRYYIPPLLGDSHFFGRGTVECNATGQKNPSFVLESPDFMQLFLPAAGNCPAATTPVYRVFSNRPDANHRYMTDRTIRDQMVARGWLVEGDGPDAVVMCAPS